MRYRTVAVYPFNVTRIDYKARPANASGARKGTPVMTPRIQEFLARERPATPCLVVDLEQVAANYRRIAALAPWADIFYAVKANPAPEILRTLCALGASYDAASPTEIRVCLAAGATPGRISYGNTVKKRSDIEPAVGLGIGLLARKGVV